MRSQFYLTTAFALFSIAGTSASYAQTHDYQFSNSYGDAFGGPSLSPDGGTLSANGYSFAADQGLNLSSAINSSVYSIDMTFELDAVSGYRKLIDFDDKGLDAGLYILNGNLNFYPIATGTTVIAPGQFVEVTLDRDATGEVTGFLNSVQQFQFADTSNLATFGTSNNLIRFFEDDTHTGGNESSGGTVTHISINGAPVPEASSSLSLGVLLALGAGGLALTARRRKNSLRYSLATQSK